MRQLFVFVHRYVGLLMSVFLIITGLTGSILVWYHELDVQINADMMRVAQPDDKTAAIPILVLREQLQAHYPGAVINWTKLNIEPGESAQFWLEPGVDTTTGNLVTPPYDEVFVNPYNGDVLGGRNWGNISEGWVNLLPFIYRLHYSLALGSLGIYLLGIIALLWTIDCFIGFYLTLPRNKPYVAKWRPAWKVKAKRFNFDLHRAGGLWFWAILFVLAWSSVAFNLREVYSPVTRLLFDYHDHRAELPDLATPLNNPQMSFAQAHEKAKWLASQLADQQGFEIVKENFIQYVPIKGLYRYAITSDLDITVDGGATQIWFDGNTGELMKLVKPSSQHAGNTVTNWLYSLHMAKVWGLPFKLFIFVAGLTVVTLSVTGVIIWWRKRRARQHAGRTNFYASTNTEY